MLHQPDGGVLQHFCIDIEVGNLRTLPQSAKHSIGTRTHSTLQVEERLGDKSLAKVVKKEVGNVLSYLSRYGVCLFERASLVRNVAFQHSEHSAFINLNIWLTDAVTGLGNHHRSTVWVVFYLIDIMNTH